MELVREFLNMQAPAAFVLTALVVGGFGYAAFRRVTKRIEEHDALRQQLAQLKSENYRLTHTREEEE
jgi:cell division protein FtsB